MDPHDHPSDPGGAFARLVAIMSRLRGEGGCPWDREQTLESLRPYLVEETYELLDALDHGGPREHLEELGDVLLQIVFQAEIRREEREFDATAVANAISDKLVRRHPHVFGDLEISDPGEVVRRWEQIKASEKRERASRLDGVPRALPALARAERITEKAARVGFDWPDPRGPRAKVDEELAELDAALDAADREQISAELGDVLLAVVNLARHLDVRPEDALRRATDRFEDRFRAVEDRVRASGREMLDVELRELDELWEEVKSESSRRRDLGSEATSD